MAGFIEFTVKGGKRALILSNSFVGFIAPGTDLLAEADEKNPMRLIFGSGEYLDVGGYSAVELVYVKMRADGKSFELFTIENKQQYWREALDARGRQLAGKGVDLHAILSEGVGAESADAGD